MERRLIFTADDYGVSPIIDDAIHSAVSNGVVTAVSAFANVRNQHGKFSVEKAVRLKQQFRNISIGIHFTITSGERVSDAAYSLSRWNSKRKRHFRGVATQHTDKAIGDHIIQELRAQIHVFDLAGLHIDFFSDHHGILSTSMKGTSALILVVKEYNERKKQELQANYKPIPIRNPLFISGQISDNSNCLDKSKMYTRARLGAAVKNLFRQKLLSKINLDFDVLKDYLKQIHQNEIVTSDYFIENFYANGNKKTLQCILDRAPDFAPNQRNTINNRFVSSEIVVHLAIVPDNPDGSYSFLKAERMIKDYGGISTAYIRNHRGKEFKTLSENLIQLIQAGELSSFDY